MVYLAEDRVVALDPTRLGGLDSAGEARERVRGGIVAFDNLDSMSWLMVLSRARSASSAASSPSSVKPSRSASAASRAYKSSGIVIDATLITSNYRYLLPQEARS